MTIEEAKSCICTIKILQKLAYNIHGVMDVVDADNCKKIIKALEQELCDKYIKEIDHLRKCISKLETQQEIFASYDYACDSGRRKSLAIKYCPFCGRKLDKTDKR